MSRSFLTRIRWAARSLCLLPLAGGLSACATSNALDKAALGHEERADRFARLGDGEGAARERQTAADLRATARLREQRQGAWYRSEVLMR